MNYVKNAVAAYAMYHYLCCLPAVFWGFKLWRPAAVAPSLEQTGAVAAASVLFCFVSVFAYSNFGDSVFSSRHAMDLLNEFGYTKELVPPLSFYIVIVNPVLEELFWRGVILTKLDSYKVGIKNFGIIWSSICFGALHYPILQQIMYPGWAEFGATSLACLGAMLAFLYKKTNSIVIPILIHSLIADLAFVVLMFTMFKRLQIPGW